MIEGRIGVAPWESLNLVESEFEEHLGKLKVKDGWFEHYPVEIEWFGGRWQPGELATDHLLIKKLSHYSKEVLEYHPAIEASPWGTDGGILSQAMKIPVVVFGPGTTEVAHNANEYIEIEKIFQAAHIFTLLILDWCNKE